MKHLFRLPIFLRPSPPIEEGAQQESQLTVQHPPLSYSSDHMNFLIILSILFAICCRTGKDDNQWILNDYKTDFARLILLVIERVLLDHPLILLKTLSTSGWYITWVGLLYTKSRPEYLVGNIPNEISHLAHHSWCNLGLHHLCYIFWRSVVLHFWAFSEFPNFGNTLIFFIVFFIYSNC